MASNGCMPLHTHSRTLTIIVIELFFSPVYISHLCMCVSVWLCASVWVYICSECVLPVYLFVLMPFRLILSLCYPKPLLVHSLGLLFTRYAISFSNISPANVVVFWWWYTVNFQLITKREYKKSTWFSSAFNIGLPSSTHSYAICYMSHIICWDACVCTGASVGLFIQCIIMRAKCLQVACN